MKKIHLFILFANDTIVAAWGDTITPTSLHSARKSISSTIYAMYTGKGVGQLDLDKTLTELGIDDYPNPLTDLQKQAKVLHLIKGTSGINHAAAGEPESMRNEKNRVLGTGPHVPGTIWAYNNWDYNTLISIFEQQTRISEREAFLENIAYPLQMKDITDNTVCESCKLVGDADYQKYRCYTFHWSSSRMTGQRDLQRQWPGYHW